MFSFSYSRHLLFLLTFNHSKISCYCSVKLQYNLLLMFSLTTVDPLVYVQFQKQSKPFMYMFSVDYSRTSCLFSVLATVETFCICSMLTTVETFCLCSDLSTSEPFVYFQFNYSRSHMCMCSLNYSIHSHLFLALTTVEPCVCSA